MTPLPKGQRLNLPRFHISRYLETADKSQNLCLYFDQAYGEIRPVEFPMSSPEVKALGGRGTN